MRATLRTLSTLGFVALTGVACGRAPAKTPATDAIVKKLPLEMKVARLANGLKVVVQEDHRVPSVAVNVVYHVGSSADPPGRTGFAHLFEHLMFEGSKHVGRGQFEAAVLGAGGTYNAATTWDTTWYYTTLPAEHLDLALWLESDRMGFLLDKLDQATLDNVRSVVKNEYRQRLDGEPYGLVQPLVRTALFPAWHPYSHDPIGSLADLDQASLEDVRRFFLRWYMPNNATLVVVGDVRADDVLARAAKWFGGIPKGPEPPVLPVPGPVVLERAKVLEIEADVELPRIVYAWWAPPFDAPGNLELASAGNLLAWNLGGQLIKEKKLASLIGAWVVPGMLASVFTVTIALEPNASAQKVLELGDEVIGRMSRYARWWIDPNSVKQSLYPLYAGDVFSLDGITRRAEAFGLLDRMTGAPDSLPRMLRAYETLGEDAVANVFSERITHSEPVIAIVKPRRGAPHAGALVRER